jgi:hypothetical protein
MRRPAGAAVMVIALWLEILAQRLIWHRVHPCKPMAVDFSLTRGLTSLLIAHTFDLHYYANSFLHASYLLFR